MFLIRTAFWVGLILLLLPTNKEGQQVVFGTMEAAIRDMQGFCLRNPEACAHGREAFAQLSDKAVSGFRMVAGLATDAVWQNNSTVSTIEAKLTAARELAAQDLTASQNTLTSADIEPDWRLRAPSSGG